MNNYDYTKTGWTAKRMPNGDFAVSFEGSPRGVYKVASAVIAIRMAKGKH